MLVNPLPVLIRKILIKINENGRKMNLISCGNAVRNADADNGDRPPMQQQARESRINILSRNVEGRENLFETDNPSRHS